MWTINLSVKHNSFEQAKDSLSNKLTKMEFEIVKGLYALCPKTYKNMHNTEFGRSNSPWTRKIKDTLLSMGSDRGFLTLPNKNGKNNSYINEWLFDIIWLKLGDSIVSKKEIWMNQPQLVLACESEWRSDNKYNILEDFLKLTFSNAEIKLFIYSNTFFPRLNKSPADYCFAACNNENHRYLLIGFPINIEENFRIDFFKK